MAVWQFEKAKIHLDEMVEEAINNGPQVITRHSCEHAVLLSIEDYQ